MPVNDMETDVASEVAAGNPIATEPVGPLPSQPDDQSEQPEEVPCEEDVEEDTEADQDQTATAAVKSGQDKEGPADKAAPAESEAMARARERMDRFRALQARAQASSAQNLKEARTESRQQATDPTELARVRRRRETAERKLERAEVEEGGQDYERKRAWDWTVEESEAWDRRVRRREARRDNNAFQDYRAEAAKVYKRQVRGMQPDLAGYERDKMAAIDRAAAAGGLDIVETSTGELIAVDRDGSFYSTADSAPTLSRARPDKAAIDRLVADLRKAEDVRLKHRRDRLAAAGDDADVTYINEKNKQFNQKLARFYNKYTADIRESFERGTMI